MDGLESKLCAMVDRIEQLEKERREAIADKQRFAYTDKRTGEYTEIVAGIEAELNRTMKLIEILTRK